MVVMKIAVADACGEAGPARQVCDQPAGWPVDDGENMRALRLRDVTLVFMTYRS